MVNDLNPHERRCLYAYTEGQVYKTYPAYLNVTLRADGYIEITVRSRDTCSAGMIALSPAEWAAFKLQLSEPLDQN
jgi:hypothetical protein